MTYKLVDDQGYLCFYHATVMVEHRFPSARQIQLVSDDVEPARCYMCACEEMDKCPPALFTENMEEKK